VLSTNVTTKITAVGSGGLGIARLWRRRKLQLIHPARRVKSDDVV
jgi:hypothetical protein